MASLASTCATSCDPSRSRLVTRPVAWTDARRRGRHGRRTALPDARPPWPPARPTRPHPAVAVPQWPRPRTRRRTPLRSGTDRRKQSTVGTRVAPIKQRRVERAPRVIYTLGRSRRRGQQVRSHAAGERPINHVREVPRVGELGYWTIGQDVFRWLTTDEPHQLRGASGNCARVTAPGVQTRNETGTSHEGGNSHCSRTRVVGARPG